MTLSLGQVIIVLILCEYNVFGTDTVYGSARRHGRDQDEKAPEAL